MKYSVFFELLQVAIGTRDKLTQCLSDKEWALLYAMCKRQSLIGIGFAGISRLPAEQRPPLRQLAQWIHDGEKIKEKNTHLTEMCVKVSEQFSQDGFICCILKGQGNQLYYPEWLKDYRMSGDIDIWVAPKNSVLSLGRRRKAIVKYVKDRIPEDAEHECEYHHIDFPIYKDTPIEVHFTPSWMYNPITNRRVQKWFEENIGVCDKVACGDKSFPIPTSSFNVVYQLMHIYRHVFIEGIGLRQLLDYYFVLRKLGNEESRNLGMDSTDSPQADSTSSPQVMRTLVSFGMAKFAGAVMYVLQQVFAMSDGYLICKPNEKEGHHLLREVLIAGNFGRYDTRVKASSSQSRLGSLIRRHAQTSRFMWAYPQEALFELPFRAIQYLWRKWNGYL